MLSGNNPQDSQLSGNPGQVNSIDPSGINWGVLAPQGQMSPIRTSSPMAQPAQMQNQPPQSSSTPLSQDTPSTIPIYNPTPPLEAAGGFLGHVLQNDPGSITQQLSLDAKNKISDNIQMINQAAQQTFPNNPIMQQLAAAQASQESGYLGGNPSQLASKYNNIFGVKGAGSQGSENLWTTEYQNGKPQNVKQGFAHYKNIGEAMDAYKKLMQNPRYAGVLNAKTFDEAAQAVQSAGYATDPNYAKQLHAVNDRLSHINTTNDAHNIPTPYINGGAPIPPEMEKTSAFHQAMTSYANAREAGTTKSPYVVSVDFSQPATAKRLSVINAETGKVVFQSEVAQGQGDFSNEPGSHASSLGTFQTTQIYDGKHGQSLRIRGMNPGLNDKVEERDVVVHGANYIGNGKTGHSFGCFAVPQENAPKLINLIKDGTIIQASAGSQGI